MNILLSEIVIQFPGMKKPLLTIPHQEIPEGSRLLVRGASGSGKTTLLHVMAGLLDPHQGSVQIDRQRIQDWSENARCHFRRKGLGVVFQRLNLLGHMTALENVLLGTPYRKGSKTECLKALKRVQMDTLWDHRAYHLSLGEQQRVAVARVLYCQPNIILADEPTSSLDDHNAELVLEALLEAAENSCGPGKGTLIISTHDQRLVSRFSRVWQLQGGGIQ
jgi:ABC-type lipoprotein export system ATPase subunit